MVILNLLVRSVAALAGLAGLARADTCAEVERLSNIELFRQSQLPYTQEQTEYWSTTCSALQPSCILYPATAEEVSAIVKILNKNDEHFAIKSGGHNPNEYFSSISGGPLISTKYLNSIILNPDTGVVRVGPGNRWDDVAIELDGTGWSVVGGRVGNVGVGGYLLGGGLSFMSQEYGWAMSSILELEVVLANGTIVAASATQNEDLFKVLKGGGNNFGIVTSFLIQAHRQGQVYGGNIIFPASKEIDAVLLQAVRDFTEYNRDDKAAIILTATMTAINETDLWIMFVYYNGPVVPQGIFDNFTSVPSILNTCQPRSYADLVVANNAYLINGSAYNMGTETFPLPSAGDSAEVLGSIHSHWRDIASSAISVPGLIASIAYQPYPKQMARVSREKGEDLLDFDDELDRIILDLNNSYFVLSDFDKVDKAMKDSYTGFRELTIEWQNKGKLPCNVYLPLFMNDCHYPQEYFQRLRPGNYELAKEMAELLDPNGLFRDRTGGFKL